MAKMPEKLYVRVGADVNSEDIDEMLMFDEGEKVAEYRLVRVGVVNLNPTLKVKGGN